MKIKITTLALLFISTALFGQEGWKTLEQEEYAISYPKDWVSSDQKPQPSIQFLLLADEASQKEDLFRENINLNTEDLGGNDMDVEVYAKKSIDQISMQIPSAKIISNQNIKVNGQDAVAIVWSADFGNGMVLKFKQIIITYNQKGYALTFSSSDAEYNQYIEVGDKILNSFKLAR